MLQKHDTDTDYVNVGCDGRKRCSEYDNDCHQMTEKGTWRCFTDSDDIFIGGPADGYCPMLGGE